MRYLIVFTNGHKEEVYGNDWLDVQRILSALVARIGCPPDLIYMLDIRRR